MVVLAASIITKSGKPLVSRQFVDMSRIRIEGYLAAFPKLVGSGGKQHTFVETENVRYVYQSIESLYLVLVTNKQSNILEDLGTLTLLSKLVPEFAYSLDDEGICKTAFEIIFAFDEAISLGHKENVTVAQVKQYCEMESHEERLHKLVMQSKINDTKDVMKRKANEIDKSKLIEKSRTASGYAPLQSMSSGRIDSGFGSDTSMPSTGASFGSQSGFGISSDVDSFSVKPKGSGRPSAPANAPPKGSGMQLGKAAKKNQLLDTLTTEDSDFAIPAGRSTPGQAGPVAPPPTDPVTFTIEEKLNATLKKDGGISSFDVQGTLCVQILNPDDGQIHVQVETNPSVVFKTHPNINKELFNNENIIAHKDPTKSFPANQPGDGVSLLRWRMQSTDESLVPLTINCWPAVDGNETSVNIEYEAFSQFDLQNVVISVPLPTLRDGQGPNVKQIDGDWRYDSRNYVLEWSIILIDNSNRSGSLEFVVPAADPSVFFPMSVRFTATNTFSGLQVMNVTPQRGGPGPRFSQRATLSTDNYQVV